MPSIESASRFDSAGKIATKTRMTFSLMAVSCQTFSLGHILIDYVFSATSHDGDMDGRDGLRRAAKSGDYCVAKTAPPM